MRRCRRSSSGRSIAKDHYSGARTWALLVSSFAAGTIVGGIFALRFRPRRPLAASCLSTIPWLLQPLGLALHAPVAFLAAISVGAGIGIAVHLALWFTVFQKHVPEEARSRVSSYDALGSLVLVPIGAAIAGPVAALIGASTTLLGAFVIMVACFAATISQPSVWAIRDKPGRLAGAEAAA